MNDNSNINNGGAKYDNGKEPFELIPSYPLRELAKLYGEGAKKYAVRNWERGIRFGRLFGALMRHAWLWWGGEKIDPETGVSHMTASAWNCFALIELERTGAGEDDRECEFLRGVKRDNIRPGGGE